MVVGRATRDKGLKWTVKHTPSRLDVLLQTASGLYEGSPSRRDLSRPWKTRRSVPLRPSQLGPSLNPRLIAPFFAPALQQDFPGSRRADSRIKQQPAGITVEGATP